MKKGAVSMYVVIFTTLLLSIISIGFLRIMMAEQRMASNHDLSTSAFDSAMAGIEDGKVVALAYHECMTTGGVNGTNNQGLTCSNVVNAVRAENNCNTIFQSRFGTSQQNIVETPVGGTTSAGQATEEDALLNQAYTCLTITPDTEDFLATLSPDGASEIVPLYFKPDNTIKSIVLRWWRNEDANGAINIDSDRCRDGASYSGLRCFLGRTTQGEPPVIRWQYINGGDSYVLHDDNDMIHGNSLNSEQRRATLFFAPTDRSGNPASPVNPVWGMNATGNNSRVASSIVENSGSAINRTGTTNLGFGEGNTPLPVHCDRNFGNKGYACSVRIVLPQAINTSTNRGSMIRLTAYNGSTASVAVEGWSEADGGNIVLFDGVQPEIDSTGRASDLFRRVFSRISLTSGFPYPEWSLELTGTGNNTNLCKNFAVWPDGVQNHGCN